MTITRYIDVFGNKNECNFRLSARELRLAYEEQQHIYDIGDIKNELDIASEDYIEAYGIDKHPVTSDEIEAMATKLRKILEADADACWSSARQEAVEFVLEKRKER